VTSFTNIIYGNVAAGHPETNSMLLFDYVRKKVNANENYSEMRPVRQAIHVWCTKFARSSESVVDKERPGRHAVATTDSTTAAVDTFVTRWDKCLNELRQYVEK